MSKISKAAESKSDLTKLRLKETVKNFMDGDSYVINPIDTLKMVTASSIFGEPAYYRGSEVSNKPAKVTRNRDKDEYKCNYLMGMSVILEELYNEKVEDVMTKVIDDALDYDFEATIKWAKTLRTEYYMRLNPQVIMARAAIHPKRKVFTATHEDGAFRDAMKACMTRADDALNGMAYYIWATGDKKNMPSVMKRAYADHLSGLNAYEVHKYQNSGIGIINGVRLCHANSPVINELMQNGSVEVDEEDNTWEALRSAGKSWVEIFNTIHMGHMAMLRNLRGFFTEVDDREILDKYLDILKKGVKNGKQFPFRYYSAYKAIQEAKDVNFKTLIMDALEDCLDIACENLPKIKGKTMILSDNSGSAWNTCNSEYGTVTVAEIDNLSAVITASRSDEGYVGKFGDRLVVYPISKRNGLLKQAMEISDRGEGEVGGATEGGIWKFFKQAIDNKEHWDNIFIYSDMQAGHGGLYGTYSDKDEYKRSGYDIGGYVNVFKLVLDYRKMVFKKVNVFSVQTAGYDNNVLPEYAYRTNLMYGWTGKEIVFADAMIKQWDDIENRAK